MKYFIKNLNQKKKGFEVNQIVKIRTELLNLLNAETFDNSEVKIEAGTFKLTTKNNAEMLLNCLERFGAKVEEEKNKNAFDVGKGNQVYKTSDDYFIINGHVVLFEEKIKTDSEIIELEEKLKNYVDINAVESLSDDYKLYKFKYKKNTRLAIAKDRKNGFLINPCYKRFITNDFKISKDHNKIFFYKNNELFSIVFIMSGYEIEAENAENIPLFIEEKEEKSEIMQVIESVTAVTPKIRKKTVNAAKTENKTKTSNNAINYITRKPYYGRNAEILPSGEYLTAAQGSKIGLKIKNNSKGYEIRAVYENDNGEKGCTSYEVYNILDFEKMTAEDEEKRINDLIKEVA